MLSINIPGPGIRGIMMQLKPDRGFFDIAPAIVPKRELFHA